ncbi:hypothetical protein DYH55_06355 [Methylovirgula sp. 4M-Z18]|nr:hypothetical protein DYH55_06355 [Methylovirgula sp. 4M-Z18]
MRCAQATGAKVFVLGRQNSRKLKYSKFCAEFITTDREIDGRMDLDLAHEINFHCARLNIDLVLAGDAPSTRSLIQLRSAVNTPCFPMPTLSVFDELNDKWRFGLLCKDLDIDYPKSQLFANVGELRQELSGREVNTSWMAKPLSMDGGMGCIKLTPEEFEAQFAQITYEPILLQEFVEGEDIGASVFCKEGEILAFIAHKFEHDTYFTFYDHDIYRSLAALMTRTKANGVFNFDMRRTSKGRVVFLECNPRFYFKMAMSMVVGVNFVAFGLTDGQNARLSPGWGAKIARFPKAFLLQAASFRKMERESWNALKFVLADPIPYALELLKLQE